MPEFISPVQYLTVRPGHFHLGADGAEQLTATLEDYEKVMLINTTTVFLCYKHAARKMVEQGRGGRIIGVCLKSYTMLPLLTTYLRLQARHPSLGRSATGQAWLIVPASLPYEA